MKSQEEVYDDELPEDIEVTDLNAPHFPINRPLHANCGRPFQWRKIFDGTLNFQPTFLLGRGVFGKVYRCHFAETNEVGAVKIQKQANRGGHKEFLSEVITLHAADHQHVIKLLGRCYGRRNRAIVYEFMPNGSLDRHIFVHKLLGTEDRFVMSSKQISRKQEKNQGLQQPTRVLDWVRRMKIALGVAQGLIYVHEELKVIHRDVKAENILLDANFVPKLSDFGSAISITVNQNGDEEQSERNPIKGTPGYMAPETEQSRMVSTKSDVYSYGVFLLVLFTGRKVIDPQESFILTDWFKRVWADPGYAPVDVALGKKYPVEGLNRIYQTATMCINQDPHARPAMRIVERMVLQASVFQVQMVERRHSI